MEAVQAPHVLGRMMSRGRGVCGCCGVWVRGRCKKPLLSLRVVRPSPSPVATAYTVVEHRTSLERQTVARPNGDLPAVVKAATRLPPVIHSPHCLQGASSQFLRSLPSPSLHSFLSSL